MGALKTWGLGCHSSKSSQREVGEGTKAGSTQLGVVEMSLLVTLPSHTNYMWPHLAGAKQYAFVPDTSIIEFDIYSGEKP